jgi:hypothetical protein
VCVRVVSVCVVLDDSKKNIIQQFDVAIQSQIVAVS